MVHIITEVSVGLVIQSLNWACHSETDRHHCGLEAIMFAGHSSKPTTAKALLTFAAISRK